MVEPFVVRRADITDIEALSQLCQKTFRETFMNDFPVDHAEQILNSPFRSWTNEENLAKKINNSQQAIWLIEDQSVNEIVACVIAGCCEVDDIPHSDVCLNKDGILSFFYVRSDRQNQGLAQQLMDIILPWFDEQYPSRPIWLTVWSKDVLTQLMKRPANL